MGAATRASLEAIKSQSAGTTSSAAVVSGVCELGRAIAGYPALLQALADHGQDASKRTALLNEAASGASKDALELASSLIALEWSKPADFLAGVEQLAVRLASNSVGSTDLIGELLQVGRVIRGHSELQLALSDKRAKAEAKMVLVEKLLAKKASAETLEIVKHVVALPRGRRVSDALAAAAAMVADQQGLGLAEVQVAQALSAANDKAVREMLTKKFGRDHYLDVVIDAEVIGGVRIRVGDVVIDASVSKQLHDMRLQLAS
jgi:F-type H+-transporting ATPase subunit delta